MAYVKVELPNRQIYQAKFQKLLPTHFALFYNEVDNLDAVKAKFMARANTLSPQFQERLRLDRLLSENQKAQANLESDDYKQRLAIQRQRKNKLKFSGDDESYNQALAKLQSDMTSERERLTAEYNQAKQARDDIMRGGFAEFDDLLILLKSRKGFGSDKTLTFDEIVSNTFGAQCFVEYLKATGWKEVEPAFKSVNKLSSTYKKNGINLINTTE